MNCIEIPRDDRQMFRFLGKKDEAVHPFIDTVASFSSISIPGVDVPGTWEELLIQGIEFPRQRGKLSKLNSDEEYYAQYGQPFNIDIFSQAADRYSQSIDLCVFVMVYECFTLINDENSHTLENLKKVLLGLLRIKVKRLERERDLAFGQIIVLVLADRSRLDNDMISIIITQYSSNPRLDTHYFKDLTQFCMIVATSQYHEPFGVSMLGMLQEMVQEKREIINIDRACDLVGIIQPYVTTLNVHALNLIATLSSQTSNAVFTDIFILMAAIIVQMAVAQSVPYAIAQNPVPEIMEFAEKGEMADITTDFHVGIYEQPTRDADSAKTLFDLMNSDVCAVVERVVRTMKMCSPGALEVFGEALKRLVSGADGSGNFGSLLSVSLAILRGASVYGERIRVVMYACQLKLFNDGETIFDDEPVGVMTETLRNSVMEMTDESDVKWLGCVSEILSNRPLMFCEFLVRLSNRRGSVALKLFEDEGYLRIVFGVSKCLQRMTQTKRVQRCRSALFGMFREVVSLCDSFASVYFTEHFLSYMFETNITDYVLDVWKRHLSDANSTDEVVTSAYIMKIITVCQKRRPDLAEKIAAILGQTLEINGMPIACYSEAISILLRTAQEARSGAILDHVLNLIVIFSRDDPWFKWPLILTGRIIDCIMLLKGEDPSEKLEHVLFSILAGCFSYGCRFLFKQPGVIPVILAAFGRSRAIDRVLNYIERQIEYSDVNKRIAHDGFLDLLLCRYVGSKTSEIVFTDYLSFPFKADREQCRRIIIGISSVKSSLAVATELVDAVECEDDARFMAAVIAPSIQSRKMEQLPIGLIPPQFAVTGIQSELLNNGFTLSFLLLIDAAAFSDRLTDFDVFRFSDVKGNSITMLIRNEMLVAQSEYGDRRTTVNVVKRVEANNEYFLVINFRISEPRVIISTVMDRMILGDSDMGPFMFAEGDVRLTVGGAAPLVPVKRATALGAVSCFTVYGESLSPALVCKDPEGVVDEILVSSDAITSHSMFASRVIPKGYRGHMNKENGTLVYEVCETVPASENIVKAAIHPYIVNTIARKFVVPGALLVLNMLFTVSEEAQRNLSKVDEMMLTLMETNVTYDLYLNLYNVMGSISCQVLRVQWLEKLIINIWVWCRGTVDDLKLILNHWSYMVNTCVDIIGDRKYMGELFNRLCLFFDVGQDPEEREGVDSHVSRRVMNVTYSKQEIVECRELFLAFMQRVASIQFTVNDVSLVFMHLQNVKSKDMLLCMLKFIASVARFIPIKGYFDDLASICCGDLDIDTAVIIATHELANVEPYSRLLAFAHRISDAAMFDRLLIELPKYTNLLALLCMLAVSFDRSSDLLNAINDVSASMIAQIVKNREWYVFLFFIASNTEKAEQKQEVCRICAAWATPTDLRFITTYLRYIAHVLPKANCDFLYMFLVELEKYTGSASIFDIAFDSAFYHFSTFSYHQIVLDMFKKENINFVPEGTRRMTIPGKFKGVPMVRALSTYPFDKIVVGFELRLLYDNSHRDANLMILAEKYAHAGHDSTEKTLARTALTYFLHKKSLSDEATRMVEWTLDETIQTRLTSYQVQTRAQLYHICTQLKLFMKYTGDTNEIPNTAKERQEIMDRELLFATVKAPPPIKYVHDMTSCALYSPMKLKRVPAGRRTITDPPIVESRPIFQSQCMRVKCEAETEVSFVLTKNAFSLGNHHTHLNNVKYVLLRRRKKGNTAIEFFLRNGKMILLDFAPLENTKILKKLESVDMEFCSLLEKGRPSEVFAKLNHTFAWQRGLMSNFAYLIHLNMISGRSYNDNYIYPLFPSITMKVAPLGSDEPDVVSGLTIDELHAHQSPTQIPEYFCRSMSEHSDVETVYKHRKDLESDAVSRDLHKFVDIFFGHQMKSGMPNKKLFSQAHVRRQNIVGRSSMKFTQQLFTGRSVDFCCIRQLHAGKFEVFALSRRGHPLMATCTVKAAMKWKDSPKEPLVAKSSGTIISGLEKHVAVFDRRTLQCTVLNGNKVEWTAKISFESSVAVCCGVFGVLYCLNNTTVCLRSQVSLSFVCRTKSPVSSIVASEAFKIFAVATLNGDITVYSLRTGAQVMTSRVHNEILAMLITPMFGFIVVITKLHITLLSVDGDFLKSVPHAFDVRKAFVVSSAHDLDYVALITSENKLVFFEALYPDHSVTVSEDLREPVMCVSYVPIIGAFVTVSKNGLVRTVGGILP